MTPGKKNIVLGIMIVALVILSFFLGVLYSYSDAVKECNEFIEKNYGFENKYGVMITYDGENSTGFTIFNATKT